MRFLVGLLILLLLVDLMYCGPAKGRKKKGGKNKKNKSDRKKPVEPEMDESAIEPKKEESPVKKASCIFHGQELSVGERKYKKSICGYCHCKGDNMLVCDRTVCDHDENVDSCEGRRDWTPWTSADGCFSYYCYRGNRGIHKRLPC